MNHFSIDDYLKEIDLKDIIKDSEKIEDIKNNFFSKIIECINVFNQEIISKLNEIKSTPEKFKEFCESFESDNNMLNLLGNNPDGSDGLIKYLTEYLERDDVNAIMVDKYYKEGATKEQFINKVKEYAEKMYNDTYKNLITQINQECMKGANEKIEPKPVVTPSELGKIIATVKQGAKEINKDSGYYTVNIIERTIIELKSSKEEDFSPTYQINKSEETNISNKKITLTPEDLIRHDSNELTINISADNHEHLEIKIKIEELETESFSIEVKEGEDVIEPDTDDKYQLQNNENVEIVVSGLDTDMHFLYKIHDEKEKSTSGQSIEPTQKINIPKDKITEINIKEFNVEIKQTIPVAGGGEQIKNQKTIRIIKKSIEEPPPVPPPDPSEKIELGAPPDTQYDQIGVADLPKGINSTDKISESNKILAILQVSGQKDSDKFVDYYFVHSNKIIKNKDKSEQEIQIMDNSVKLINEKYCIKFYINNIKTISELNKGDKISVTSIFFNQKLDIIKNILSETNNEDYEDKIYLIKDNNDNIENGVISEILEFQHNDNYSKFVNLNGVELAKIKKIE